MPTLTVAAHLSRTLVAYLNCVGHSPAWVLRHTSTLDALAHEHLPSGSGIDAGCTLNIGLSEPNRLVIDVPYHLMDEHGGYCGWVDVRVVVTASLAFGFDVTADFATPQDRDIAEDVTDPEGLLDYIGDTMAHALDQTVCI